MGEQVAGKAGYGWFDGVAADLASENYASRYVDIPSCAVDAPHIRSRGYWIARALGDASIDGQQGCGLGNVRRQEGALPDWSDASANELVSPPSVGRREGRAEPELRGGRSTVAGADASGIPRYTAFERRAEAIGEPGNGFAPDWEGPANCAERTHGINGSFWSDYKWLTCHDGKARRTQPGLPLLVDGLPGRVAAWRGFGNAINPVLAAEVLAAYLDTENSCSNHQNRF